MRETYVCPDCEQSIEWDDSICEEFVKCPHCGGKFRAPNAPMFTKGTVIGDYVIEKRLGIGGMGEVYLAEQRSMLRKVALKVLQPDLIEDKSYLERFYREVRLLAQIEHPNIVKAIETGYENEICYFSMSYIEGNDLKHKLDTTGRMAEIDALYVMLNVAGALKFVWERHKLIHRDIKPANIILTGEREVKLMDLGISKVVAEEKPADLTLAGMMVGSPYYVSPEQARAKKNIDWRADMYSLGATFYHMITGEVPFDSESSMGIIAAHLSEPVPDPREKNPEISDTSAYIIGRMMQKKREDRFTSWDEAIEMIETAIAEVAEQGAETTIMSSLPIRAHAEEFRKNHLTGSHEAVRPASPDAVEKIKTVISKTVLGNLRVRFTILVVLLFLTFLFFFRAAKGWVHDAALKEAKQKISEYKTYKQQAAGTKRERQKLYKMLDTIRKLNLSETSDWVNSELEALQKQAYTERRSRDKENIKRELDTLKETSYSLEREGKIAEAIDLWQSYAEEGAYSEELKHEIERAVQYLKTVKKKRSGFRRK